LWGQVYFDGPDPPVEGPHAPVDVDEDGPHALVDVDEDGPHALVEGPDPPAQGPDRFNCVLEVEKEELLESLLDSGSGCHSATKISIILSVNIVENFFCLMHASMNSSWVMSPSLFSSISVNAVVAKMS